MLRPFTEHLSDLPYIYQVPVGQSQFHTCLFAIIAAIQFLGVFWAAHTEGPALLVALESATGPTAMQAGLAAIGMS